MPATHHLSKWSTKGILEWLAIRQEEVGKSRIKGGGKKGLLCASTISTELYLLVYNSLQQRMMR